MDYPCAKFGDFSFSRFGFIVLTDRQLDRQTDRQTGSHTDADDCYTHATPFGASNEWFFSAGDCVPAKGLVHVTLGYLSCKKQLLAVCQFTVCVYLAYLRVVGTPGQRSDRHESRPVQGPAVYSPYWKR